MITSSSGQSAAAGKRWKKQIIREMARDAETAYRQKLDDLRRAIEEKRAATRARIKEQQTACDASYQDVKAKADQAWKEAVALATEARRQAKGAKKLKCKIERDELREQGKAEKAHLVEMRDAERAYHAELRKIESSNRKRDKSRPKATAAERRSESDDEVEQNIDPDLIALWRRVRRGIKGTDRKSRTEAFHEYVEEHPDEAYAAREQAAEEALAREWNMKAPPRVQTRFTKAPLGALLAGDKGRKPKGRGAAGRARPNPTPKVLPSDVPF